MNLQEKAAQLFNSGSSLLSIAQATMLEANLELAISDLKQSAEMGFADAWLLLAECHENEWGLDYDEDETLACYKKAADLGSKKGCYLYAFLQYKNYEDDAFEYAQKALGGEQDDLVNYLIGLLYFHGIGCEQDDERSLESHISSANLGNTDAMFELYTFYSQGIGVEMDMDKAMYWNEKAASLGHYRACYNMGWYYETGTFYVADFDKAINYYQKASDANNGKATAYLGVLTEKGILKNKDTNDNAGNWNKEKAEQLADVLFKKSLQQGFFEVKEFVEGQGLLFRF